jgi:hypothetical protein
MLVTGPRPNKKDSDVILASLGVLVGVPLCVAAFLGWDPAPLRLLAVFPPSWLRFGG